MAPPRRTNAVLQNPALLVDAYHSSTSIADLADRIGVSAATVRRSLIRHGIARLPRNRNRRPPSAAVLDDPQWLARRYGERTGVEIATELGVSSHAVYAAMTRHGIERRTESGTLKLRRPQLADREWLERAVERDSSTAVAAELEVSAGTVRSAYERAGIDAASTKQLYARGRRRPRPSAKELQAAWKAESTFRGVGRRLGVAHSTAAVWLAEIGVFSDTPPALSRSVLLDAIGQRQSMSQVAKEQGVAVTTVRIELHRLGLFEAHRNRHRGTTLTQTGL